MHVKFITYNGWLKQPPHFVRNDSMLPCFLAQVAVMSTEGRHLLFAYSSRKSVICCLFHVP